MSKNGFSCYYSIASIVINILSKFHEFLLVGTCLKMALYQNHVILVQWYNWYKKVQLAEFYYNNIHRMAGMEAGKMAAEKMRSP